MSYKDKKAIAIYGYGGFGREIEYLLEHDRNYTHSDFIGFVDDSSETLISRARADVFAFEYLCENHFNAKVVVSISDPYTKLVVAEKCQAAGFKFATLIEKNVCMSNSVDIGEGSVVCSGVAMTVDIKIAKHCHINLNCTIGHDCVIEDYVTLAPGVHISGSVSIGAEVSIGTGATIVNGTSYERLEIVKGCVIGAGACVVNSLNEPGVYVGVPARLIKSYLPITD